MRACRGCGRQVEASFRFCPWCAAPQRVKVVDFFRAHPGIEGDGRRALRVSRYVGTPERHVRFSVWNESGRAEAAISLDEVEAERLAAFLLDPPVGPARAPKRLDALIARVREDVSLAVGRRRA